MAECRAGTPFIHPGQWASHRPDGSRLPVTTMFVRWFGRGVFSFFNFVAR